MTGYQFAISCPHDGSPLAHVNGAGEGTQALAVAACASCAAEYVVTVHLRALPSKRAVRDRERQRRYRARVVA